MGSSSDLSTYVPGTYTVTSVNKNSDNTVLKIEKLKLQRVESGNDQSWYCLGDSSVNVLKILFHSTTKKLEPHDHMLILYTMDLVRRCHMVQVVEIG